MNKLGKVLGFLGIILGIGGFAIGMLAAFNPQLVGSWFVALFMQDGGKSFGDFMSFKFPILFTIFMLIIMSLAFSPLIIGGINNSKKKARLKMVGIKAKASIVSVTDTNITINNSPYIKVVVEIRPGVQAEFTTMASRIAIPRAGDVIEVVYDPSNPKDVLPAWELGT